MLEPAYSKEEKKRCRLPIPDIIRNNVVVNLNDTIESLCNFLNNIDAIEDMQRYLVDAQLVNDENEADALGMVIPVEDSDIHSFSSDSLSSDISKTLFGEEKNSYVRRLKRRLQFFLLPRDDNLPMFTTIQQKKLCLSRYLLALNIPPYVYVKWFVAE